MRDIGEESEGRKLSARELQEEKDRNEVANYYQSLVSFKGADFARNQYFNLKGKSFTLEELPALIRDRDPRADPIFRKTLAVKRRDGRFPPFVKEKTYDPKRYQGPKRN